MTRVLCLADDPADAANLEDQLERLGYPPEFFADVDSIVGPVTRGDAFVAVVICRPPTRHGTELLARLDQIRPNVPVIVLAGDTNIDHAVLTMRSGAANYLPMPVRIETLARAIEHARTDHAIHRDRRAIARKQGSNGREMVGVSVQMRELRRMISMVAPTLAPVLIEGESGTGKELVARAIHAGSTRASGPFITINCAAIAEGLIESTLFGHEKGAFTGATSRQPGVFERANGGTLFLDEVSEMRLDLQAKLLRVIQESELERVGGRETIPVDVRLVASTNRNLAGEVEANRFRSDLYYRLHVVPLQTAPLRERRADIPELLNYALEHAAQQLGVAQPELPQATILALESYSWPGNVRELVNATHRAVIMANGGPLQVEHFLLPGLSAGERPRELSAAKHHDTSAGTDWDSLPINLAELESIAIERALARADGVRAHAAKLLGISERTLRNRLNLPLSA